MISKNLLSRWDAAWECMSSGKSKTLDYYNEFLHRSQNTKYTCIFGAGNEGKFLKSALDNEGIYVDFFCDNASEKQGRIINGIPCISPEGLRDIYKDGIVIAIQTQYYAEIAQQLVEMGIEDFYRFDSIMFLQRSKFSYDTLFRFKEQLKVLFDKWEDEESLKVFIKRVEALFLMNEVYFWNEFEDNIESAHFDSNIIQLSDNECYVDAGAFDGDTILKFIKASGGEFESVFAFELDPINYSSLTNRVEGLPSEMKKKITLINKGLFNESKWITIKTSGMGTSVIGMSDFKGTSTVQAELTVLDMESHISPTFIKMDIEGAELDALKGAAEAIKKHRPILSIAVYHKLEDIWEIPGYILSLVPDYKMYLRHYFSNSTGTICYAIPPERVIKNR